MRPYLVVLLVLLPAVLAIGLWWRSRDDDPQVRRTENHTDAMRGVATDTFQGSAGRGTFFIRNATVTLGGESLSYPSAYYWLGEWRRVEGEDRFDARDVLVVRNPRPEDRAALEGLLRIGAEEDAATRRRRMEDASANLSFVRAARAEFLDAPRLEAAGRIRLLDEVEGRLGEGGSRFTSERLDLYFRDDRLERLHFPGEFAIEGDRIEIAGRGFDVAQGQESLVVDHARRVAVFPGTSVGLRSPLVSIRSDGPFRVTPDATDRPRSDLFACFDFASARFEGSGGIEVASRDFRTTAQTFDGSLGRDDAGRSELRDLSFAGDVLMTAPDGEIAGQAARCDVRDGEIFSARIDGPGTRVSWGRLTDPEAPEARWTIEARGDGAVAISRRLDDAGATTGLDLEMADRVELDLVVDPTASAPDYRLAGETLVVALDAAGPAGARRFRSREVGLAGGVSGTGPDLSLAGAELVHRTSRDEAGRPTARRITLLGPARVSRKIGATARTRTPEALATIEAKRRIEVFESTSPFAPFELEAFGAVSGRWREQGGDESRMNAESLKLVVLDAASVASGESRLASLVLREKVTLTLPEGHELAGATLELFDGGRRTNLTGAPASLFLVRDETRQELHARTIVLDDATGLAAAAGDVRAEADFPAFVLTGGGGGEPRRWTITAGKLDASLAAPLPLPGRVGAKPPVATGRRLRDFRASGAVTASCVDQRLEARELFFDPSRGTGWATGAPLVATIDERVGDEVLANRLESDRLEIRPEWTLLQGRCDVRLFVASPPATPGAAPGYERLHVVCDKDVLLKPDVAYFTGHTVFDRGEADRGGFHVSADQAWAYLDAAAGGGPLGRLRRIEGLGHVDFRWGEAEGSGDLLNYEIDAGEVRLSADKGKVCTMKLQGHPSRARSLVYDQTRRRVRVVEQRGLLDRAGEKP
ncbi:MAG: hypothetical protein R3F20_11515 [Planctomycetota bacterium]